MDDLNLAQECRANAKWEYNENGDTEIHTSLCKAADAIERMIARIADAELERKLATEIPISNLRDEKIDKLFAVLHRLELQLSARWNQ